MRYPPDMVTAIHQARMVAASEEVVARRIRRRVPRMETTVLSSPWEV